MRSLLSTQFSTLIAIFKLDRSFASHATSQPLKVQISLGGEAEGGESDREGGEEGLMTTKRKAPLNRAELKDIGAPLISYEPAWIYGPPDCSFSQQPGVPCTHHCSEAFSQQQHQQAQGDDLLPPPIPQAAGECRVLVCLIP